MFEPKTMEANIGSAVQVGTWQSTPEDRKSGEIISEGHRLESHILELTEAVSALESAIGLVLRPSPPQAAASGSTTPTPLRSNLADGLSEANRRVSACIEHLRNLRSRVDL